MTDMPLGDLVERVAVAGVPLMIVWWLIAKRIKKSTPDGSPSAGPVRYAPAIAGIAIVVSVFFYLYAVFPIWAFSLGCVVGVLFGEKRIRPLIICGAVALLVFEVFYGPKFRELDQRHRGVKPSVSGTETQRD